MKLPFHIMRNKLVIVFFLIKCFPIYAQTESKQDTVQIQNKGVVKPLFEYVERTAFQYLEGSNDKSSTKKGSNFSVMPGAYYSNETKVNIGLIASGLYRLKGCGEEMDPSSVSLYSNITSIGAYSFGLKGTTFLPEMRY